MAAALPAARFVGVDASARQIEDASRVAREAGLTNVELVAARIEDADLGQFDFVLCHGVLSWIPSAARGALLAAIARALAPGAVGHVSFNVLPGWYEKMAARDFLRFFPGESIDWLARQVSPEAAGYKDALLRIARRVSETDHAYFVHEYLEAEHHPLSVSDFIDEASAAGLAYLGDAIPQTTALEHLPTEAADRARGLDVRAAQQLVDFVKGTAFRRALLVRAEDAATRGWRWSPRLLAPALAHLRVASRLRPMGGGRFDADLVSVQAPELEDTLVRLAAIAPRSVPFAELGVDSEEMLDLWLATGALDLVTHEPPIGDVSLRPRACPVARWHAAHGGPITNRRHHEVVLTEPFVRALLARLDGTHALSGEVERAAAALLARAALLEP
jgi:hypothetical protein